MKRRKEKKKEKGKEEKGEDKNYNIINITGYLLQLNPRPGEDRRKGKGEERRR